MTQRNSDIKAVIENDLCIACGACIPACPRHNLEPAFCEYRGANEIQFIHGSDCTDCSAPCVKVCPSINIDFAAISGNGDEPPERDGWIEEVYLGYSPMFQNDGKSSSGGVLRALTQFALNEKIPVITLTKNDESEIEYFPSVLSKEEELLRMPGSIYHSSSFVGAIEHLRGLAEPCVIIAIPCQLAGILNYISHVEPQLQDKIRFIYGIICGWMYSYHAHKAFKTHKKINAPLSDISYRGDDKVGLLKLKTKESIHKFNRRVFPNFSSMIDYRSAYSTDLNRLRCRLCQDHTNLLADIVVGDAWLARKSHEKMSVIGIRSPRAVKLLTTMIERGYLVVEKGSYADIVESQSENLVYSFTARKLSRLLSQRGVPIPNYHYKLDKADTRIPLAEKASFEFEFIRRDVVRKGHYKLFWWMYLLKFTTNQLLRLPRKISRKLKK